MSLTVIMYHYVRNPEGSRFKGIKGVREEAFEKQVELAKQNFHLVTLEETLAYLEGKMEWEKPALLFTFDDGLKEHASFVSPILSAHNIEGLFFLPTAAIEEKKVLPVHQNHYLLACLDIQYYKQRFLQLLAEQFPNQSIAVDAEKVKATYRWDTWEVASFKYLINYVLPKATRNHVLSQLFEQEIGKEEEMAEEIYLNWADARTMQQSGMKLGGHTHGHQVLSSLTNTEQQEDLERNKSILQEHIQAQTHYPFAYPFGKKTTYNNFTIDTLKALGYHCAFNTEIGTNQSQSSPFDLKRFDPKDLFN